MSSTETVLPPDQEARHRAAEAKVQSFKYVKPKLPEGSNKGIVRLASTGMTKGFLQIIADGGENNLHFHDGMDSFWMVIKGRVKFYGPGDKLIGEYGPMEGLITPAGARYWFEKASDEDLELLQVASYEQDASKARRISVAGDKPQSNRNQWFDGQKNNAMIDKTQA
jgi:mannose-6-phosphate isomerase-like protein (cupin superfamily)